MATFGERLRSLREKSEVTQIDLAKFLSLANSTISQYEANKRDPDSATLQKLADYFNVSVDYLLGRTTDKLTDVALEIPDKLVKDFAEVVAKLKSKPTTEKEPIFKMLEAMITTLREEQGKKGSR